MQKLLTNMLSSCPPEFTLHLSSNQFVEDTIIHLLSWMLDEIAKKISSTVGGKSSSYSSGERWCCNSCHGDWIGGLRTDNIR